MRALLFDLDGTLVDTVYAHVMAWHRTLCEAKFAADAYAVHRRIGMSGKLLVRQLAPAGRAVAPPEIEALEKRHAALFEEMVPEPRPLCGSLALLNTLNRSGIKYGIASSGSRAGIASSLEALGIGREVTVVDGDATEEAKPEPDIFVLCRQRLGVPPQECLVVGDSIWDVIAARRAGILAVGFLCGGTSRSELYEAGALRVYAGPAELTEALGELGFL